MNRYLIILLLASLCSLTACEGQGVYALDGQPICWEYNNIDSTLNRYVVVSAGSPNSVLTFLYVNAAGETVDVSLGGRLWFGYCGICTRDTLPIPRIEGFAVSEPTINPFNPTRCGSTMVATVYGVTDANSQVSVTLDGVPISYTYNAGSKVVTANAEEVTGSGDHTFILTVTIPSGTTQNSGSFGCGG